MYMKNEILPGIGLMHYTGYLIVSHINVPRSIFNQKSLGYVTKHFGKFPMETVGRMTGIWLGNKSIINNLENEPCNYLAEENMVHI